MKISKKNKKVLIWIGAILLILIFLYIFNTHFLRENFADKPSTKDDYKSQLNTKKRIGEIGVISQDPFAIWTDKNGEYFFSWKIDMNNEANKIEKAKKFIGNNQYMWFTRKGWDKIGYRKPSPILIESDQSKIGSIIKAPIMPTTTPRPTTPRPTPPSNPKSQEDCNSTGLIFKENKCKPPQNQDDCMLNLYGSIYDPVEKNCLGKITDDSCSTNYYESVYKYKDGKKSCIKNIFSPEVCKKTNQISTKDMYNNPTCRKPINQNDCDTYFDKKYYFSKQCSNKVPGGPGDFCYSSYGEKCGNKELNINSKCVFRPGMNMGYCDGLSYGQQCTRGIDCLTNSCINGVCAKSSFDGHCKNNNECLSGECNILEAYGFGTCKKSRYGEKCYIDNDCYTNKCINGVCDSPGYMPGF